MLRRRFLKLLGAAIAVPWIGCPAERLARRLVRDPHRNVWIGTVSGRWKDRRNWSLDEVPVYGDSVVFDSRSGDLTENLDQRGIRLESLTYTRGARDARVTIGKQGRTL